MKPIRRAIARFRRFLIPAALAIAASTAPAAPEDRPNIVWITAEDMSPTLGCYGDAYATTPHLDRFAAESVRFTRAFASAPVCSPARSALITGMWPVSLGTSQMRSAFPLPPDVAGFPKFLRDAGYFTANNVKTDYNTSDEPRLIRESWDLSDGKAHWRADGRAEGQPFFAVFNQMVSHQSRTMVWPHETFRKHVQAGLEPAEIHDPAAAPVPPYYPDTEIVRRTIARYYDSVTVMDREAGAILAQLEEDGLAESTIVFFFSDHGSGMPRHKRLPHDSGMKVPLMIRFPEKFRHLAPAAPGETIDRLVTFTDFPATLLSMLGLEVPDHMQGGIFLGPGAAAESGFVYGFRDRVDEAFECARSVRSARYLYIRNYMPHLSWNQPTVYSDLGEIRREITRHAAANAADLTDAQRHYAGPAKAAEEFYDVIDDPDNIRNLMLTDRTAAQREALQAHRDAFKRLRAELLDVGFVPEPIMADFIAAEKAPMRTLTTRANGRGPDLAEIWAAADLVGFGSRDELLEKTASGNDAVRYWSVIGLRHAFAEDSAALARAAELLADVSPTVRIEAAGWLASASADHRPATLTVLENGLSHDDWWIALRACRAIELLGQKARPLLPAMKRIYQAKRNAPGDENLFLAFSSGAFLDRLGETTEAWDFGPSP